MEVLALAKYTKDYMNIIFKDNPSKFNKEKHTLLNVINISDELCDYFRDKNKELDRLKFILNGDLDFGIEYLKRYTYKVFGKDYTFCILMYLIYDDLNKGNDVANMYGIRFHNYKEGRFKAFHAIQYHDGEKWINMGEPTKLHLTLFEMFVSLFNKNYLSKF